MHPPGTAAKAWMSGSEAWMSGPVTAQMPLTIVGRSQSVRSRSPPSDRRVDWAVVVVCAVEVDVLVAVDDGSRVDV